MRNWELNTGGFMQPTKINALKKIKFQYKNSFDDTALSDQEKIDKARSILDAFIVEEDELAIMGNQMPTTMLGVSLDWSAGVTDSDAIVTLTQGTANLTEDMANDPELVPFTPPVLSTPPVVSNLYVGNSVGTEQTGNIAHYLTIYAYYTYEGDTEGNTSIKWYVCDDDISTNDVLLDETGFLRATGSDPVGKYYKFEITPVDYNGIEGDPVMSSAFGPTEFS